LPGKARWRCGCRAPQHWELKTENAHCKQRRRQRRRGCDYRNREAEAPRVTGLHRHASGGSARNKPFVRTCLRCGATRLLPERPQNGCMPWHRPGHDTYRRISLTMAGQSWPQRAQCNAIQRVEDRVETALT